MKTSKLIHKVSALLSQHGIVPGAGPMFCGLSGGADSVALVLVLKELGYDVVALHCNFQLRGEESERDERFVRDFCRQHAVTLHTIRFDTRAEAVSHSESIEMAARRLRYDWFDEVLRNAVSGASDPSPAERRWSGAICVAHHADDNVETMLLNLIRGAGLHGLTGMRFENERGILRPLLTTTRTEILAYLAERGQTCVVDSTNADTQYRRNKIRYELLPLLRTMNPAIDRTLTQTMQHLQEAAELLDTIDGETAARRRRLQHSGFTMTQILQMERARNGAYTTAGNMMLTRHNGTLICGRIPETVSPTPIRGERRRRTANEDLRRPHQAVIDARAVSGPLVIRSVREGDRFRPFGMKGTKLVSDYLTDRKRSRLDKLAALVVCDDRGILWLVGETIDQRAAVTESTEDVICISVPRPL